MAHGWLVKDKRNLTKLMVGLKAGYILKKIAKISKLMGWIVHEYTQKAGHNEENVEWLEITIAEQLVGIWWINIHACIIVLVKLNFYSMLFVLQYHMVEVWGLRWENTSLYLHIYAWELFVLRSHETLKLFIYSVTPIHVFTNLVELLNFCYW